VAIPNWVPDLINGLFEVGGGVAILCHCLTLLKDRLVKGVNWASVLFFTIWGYWNLFYYPHLNQWMSFTGGILIVSGNTWWIYLILKFKRLEQKTKADMAAMLQTISAKDSWVTEYLTNPKD
jgi:uncharacterized membrane protein YfcA